jgi:hypothetical protein
MDIVQILLFPIFVLLPIIFVLYYRVYYIESENDKFFFLWGFLLKIFGAISAILIYTQYYKSGDTTYYFDSGSALADFYRNYPTKIIEALSQYRYVDYKDFDFLPYLNKILYRNDPYTITVVKIASIFNLLTNDSFLYTSLICSYFSFFAAWKFYKLINIRITRFQKQIGYAIFFMPSVIFWGSGLFKDTFTLAGLFLFYVGSIHILAYRQYSLSNIFLGVIGFLLMMKIRSFFLLVSLPFMAIWIISVRYSNIASSTIKVLFIPFFSVALFGGGYFILNSLTSTFEELKIENLQDRTKGFQSWHTTLKGSAYSIGETDFTTLGIAQKIPAAINVTLFRPYITEATKPIIFLSFLQSFIFMLITAYIILRMRVIYFFVHIFRSPEGFSLLGFSFFYAFIVGFTSYNFGALDRYKIPCLSTYIIALVFIFESYYNSLKDKIE